MSPHPSDEEVLHERNRRLKAKTKVVIQVRPDGKKGYDCDVLVPTDKVVEFLELLRKAGIR